MRRTPRLLAIGLTLLCLILPGAARAQFRGAWVAPERSVSVQVAVSYSDTDDWFCGSTLGHCSPGRRGNLSDTIESEDAQTFSTSLKLEVTPLPWLSLDAQAPFHSLRYDKFFGGDPDNRLGLESDGIGDLRVGARVGRSIGLWGVSAGYTAEFPTGDFDISANLIPVGQGTQNHELSLELGRSLYPANAYVELGAMLRFRGSFENDFGVITDWGDEIHGRLSGGWKVSGAWWVKAEASGFKSGNRKTNIPGEPEDQFRSQWVVAPGVLYQLGDRGWVDAWIRVPVDGRNAPADISFGLAGTYRIGWGGPV